MIKNHHKSQFEQNINSIFLFLLGCRLVFIFTNATTSNNNLATLRNGEIEARQGLQSSTAGDLLNQTPEQTGNLILPEAENQEPAQQILGNMQNKINLTEDINILEIAYQKEKDPKIAKTLIEKLAQNYEFEKANKYLQELITDPEFDGNIEPTLHLYIAIHDPTIVSITDQQSIQKIIPIMNEYKNTGRLKEDDYNFYQGLIKLRSKNYKEAWELFNNNSSAKYKTTIQAVTQAISTYNSSKAIPKYYQDALVSLALLKNGYFSVAKKLALETALEDNKYILPYQILAYTHFLTNNREAANDYFLKLADVDISNKNLYKFLIGISFYRSKEYNQAILYLSQVNDTSLQTDAYRYMLLSYKANNDIKSMTDTRQKLLGQSDMTGSDYYDYFYQTFYAPYSKGEKHEIYETNKLLADMYLNNCNTTFTGNSTDICKYGEIGRELTKNNTIAPTQSVDLIKLANTYNEPYLFSSIGDLYLQQNNLTEAKKNYAQALSLSTDSREQDILKSKISQINE